MKVLTISGHAGSGKDTVAEIMKERLNADGSRVLITHSADLLKYICKTYFDWDGIKDERGRTLLQYIGTNIVRKKDPDFWVRFIINILTLFQDTWDYVLIPDCRFPNEIALLRDSGFNVTSIKINRDWAESPLTSEQRSHSSETALDSYVFDCLVENDGSLDDLKVQVNKLLEGMNDFHQMSFGEIM